jgi:nicotinate-nucleotide adenylyltransferase
MSFDFRKTTAVFGGSFNPPHLGHAQAIQGLLKNPGVNKVLVMPSYGTPLKKVSVTFDQRLEMARLAFRSISQVEVSNFEQTHRTQFTWQLLEQLAPQSSDLAFVIGTDQFAKLDQWAKFPEVLGMCDWIILLRKPTTLDSAQPLIAKYASAGLLKSTGNRDEYLVLGKRLKLVETDAIEASSTLIRERMALNQVEQVNPMLAPEVREFILRNGIYG